VVRKICLLSPPQSICMPVGHNFNETKQKIELTQTET